MSMGCVYYYDGLAICKSLNLDKDSIEHSKRVYLLFGDCLSNAEVYELVCSSLWGTTVDVYLLGALLHDIGKAGIPLEFLNKPNKLTKDEFTIIKLHSDLGRFLSDKLSSSLYLNEQDYIVIGNMIQLHHENYDGTGYPFSLEDEGIPIYVRLLSILDVYDALVSRRAYKEPMSQDKALNFLISESGRKFDSNLLDLLLRDNLLINQDK